MLVSTVMSGKPICRIQRSMMVLTEAGSLMTDCASTACRGERGLLWPEPGKLEERPAFPQPHAQAHPQRVQTLDTPYTYTLQ